MPSFNNEKFLLKTIQSINLKMGAISDGPTIGT